MSLSKKIDFFFCLLFLFLFCLRIKIGIFQSIKVIATLLRNTQQNRYIKHTPTPFFLSFCLLLLLSLGLLFLSIFLALRLILLGGRSLLLSLIRTSPPLFGRGLLLSLLTLFLLLSDNILVELRTVVSNRVLVIIVDGDGDGTVANVLLGRDVELGEVRVLQSFLAQNSLLWVELEALAQEVEGVLGGVGEQVRQLGLVALLGQAVQHSNSEGGVDGLNIFVGRTPSHLKDTIQLVHCGTSGEERTTREELGQNTTNTPDIDSLCVAGRTEKNFRGTVPTGGDVLGQNGARGIGALQGSNRSSKTKVSNLEEALRIQEQVGGLQITMDDPTTVHIFQGLQKLVDDVLFMDIFEDIGTDNSMEISF